MVDSERTVPMTPDARRAHASSAVQPTALGRAVIGRGPQMPSSPAPGDRIGEDARFEIDGELGAGGMGHVFRARDTKLGRAIAIKFILPDHCLSWDQLVTLLGREARATAKLNHENIVQIFDIGAWNEIPFLVMELMEGDSLHAVLERGPLSPRAAVDMMVQVARGLAHAHEAGIVHRDLKPSNVFVLANGTVKILDFGLARIEGAHAAPPSSSNPAIASASQVPTVSGIGTPAFMAPEQWRDEPQDHRTDIWSAGIMLYQMLTGQLPFRHHELAQLALPASMRDGALAVPPVPPPAPDELNRILQRALRERASDRYQTAAELLSALVGVQPSMAPPREAIEIPAERRLLTLVSCLFSPKGAGDLDPEESSEAEAGVHASCAEIIRRGGGYVLPPIAGQLLACFGYPAAQESDACRAVRVALALVESIAARADAPVDVRIGVHTGLAIVQPLAPGGAIAIQGEAPTIAARLSVEAPSGAVVASHGTHAVVVGSFVSVPLDTGTDPSDARTSRRTYRILDERLEANRFERQLDGQLDSQVMESARDGSQRSRLLPLVGREREVALLTSAWERAKAGRGELILVTGEAGIGKSRLVQELRDDVTREGLTRMTCQCWSQFASSAFHPLIELLLRSMEITRSDTAEQKLSKVEETLTGLGMATTEQLPLFAALLSIPCDEPVSTPRLPPDVQRKKTMEALVAMLVATAARRPTAFIVEDVHWIDNSSLEFLRLLLDRVSDARLLVILTSRTDFPGGWQRQSHVHTLTLDRLPQGLTATLIENLARGAALPTGAVDQLVNRSDGIPLFAEELTRMVLESALDRAEPAAVPADIPSTLHELLLARLDRLSPAGKDVAQLGAIIGRDFSYPLLHELAAFDERTLKRGLDDLVEAGLLVRQGAIPRARYVFKHALIQQAAHNSMLKSKRRPYHRRIASVLAERFPETAETQPELLAHHCTEAGQVDEAITYWDRAGRRATERSASIEAINHFTRALSLLVTLPESPARNQRELALRLALGSPLMAVKGYAAPEVHDLYARAHELCKCTQDNTPIFPALLGLWQFYMVGGGLPTSRELGEELVQLARSSGNATYVMLAHRSLGTSMFLQGEVARSRDVSQHGLALYDFEQHRGLAFRHGHDPGVALRAYLAWAQWILGNPDQALATCLDGLAHAQRLGHPLSLAFAMCFCAVIRNHRGEHARAKEVASVAIDICTEHKLALWLAWATMARGLAIGLEGDWREGAAELSLGLERWRATGARSGLTVFPITLAEVYQRGGRIEDARRVLAEAREVVHQNAEHFYEAELLRLEGETMRATSPGAADADAERAFRQALAVAKGQSARSWQLRVAMSLADLLRARGEAVEARAVLAEARSAVTEAHDTIDPRRADAMLAELAG